MRQFRQDQSEQPAIAAAEIENAPRRSRKMIEKDAFSFRAMRNPIRNGEIAGRVFCFAPLVYVHHGMFLRENPVPLVICRTESAKTHPRHSAFCGRPGTRSGEHTSELQSH